jgi:NADH:ubiquinone oxidoreductase subunit 2 (subunit N)
MRASMPRCLPVFFLFYGAYATLTAAAAFLLVLPVRGGVAPLRRLGSAAARARVPLLALLAAFAGLPPFFFFFPKLGLLALLAGSLAWPLVAGALLLILAAWRLYYSAGSRLAHAT